MMEKGSTSYKVINIVSTVILVVLATIGTITITKNIVSKAQG